MTLHFEYDLHGSRGKSLCGLAHTLACYVEDDLGHAKRTSGRLATEEGITHTLVKLVDSWKGVPTIKVVEVGRKEESITGADLEVWFTAQDNDETYSRGWLVQSKRTDGRGWLDSLGHEVENKAGVKEYQYDLLIKAASAVPLLEPMYFFYADCGTSRLASHGEAISVVSAETVKGIHGLRGRTGLASTPCSGGGADHVGRSSWKDLETLFHAECYDTSLASARSLASFWCAGHESVESDLRRSDDNGQATAPTYATGDELGPTRLDVNYLVHIDISQDPLFS